MKISKKVSLKPRNFVAKDLMTPKYKLRVVKSKKNYDRQSDKTLIRKEVYAA